jgi:hypothetical protein
VTKENAAAPVNNSTTQATVTLGDSAAYQEHAEGEHRRQEVLPPWVPNQPTPNDPATDPMLSIVDSRP